jgi:hypothetical protein
MMSSPRTLPLLLLAFASASGCADELPDEALIIAPRILAVRTSVVAPIAPDDDFPDGVTRTQALPLETVAIEPFIVGPDGPIDPDDVDPVWIACELPPGLGLFSCISNSFPIALGDIPDCPEVDPMGIDPEAIPEPVSPCIIAWEGSPEYTVPLSNNVFIGGAIELTMIAGVPTGTDGTSTQECADELLGDEYQLPDDCLFAVQRISLGPIGRMLLLLDEFGIELDGFDPPDPEDVPEADFNPQITAFTFETLDENGEPEGDSVDVGLGEAIAAELGDRIRIEVSSPEEHLQTYPIPVNNGESTEDRDEAYQGSWYRTWGDLLSGSSDDPDSFNEWQLFQDSQDDEETPPADRAFMYYVVRDGRQGVDWWWFEVEADGA